MEFIDGPIDGVLLKNLNKYVDKRGWLIETFREDEIEKPFSPLMGYTSETLPGVTRGPHEHVDQADLFVFMGPGTFRLTLWDNRKDSKTYLHKQVVDAGVDKPAQVLVPPGVVHAYQNISDQPAIAHNYPNQLYAGIGKKNPVDEIRHEADPQTPFQIDG